jgi:hypothetical protein
LPTMTASVVCLPMVVSPDCVRRNTPRPYLPL